MECNLQSVIYISIDWAVKRWRGALYTESSRQVLRSSTTILLKAISREEWLCKFSGPRASETHQAETSCTRFGHGQTSSPVSLSSSYAWSCPPQLVPPRALREGAVAFLARSPLGGGNWGTSTGDPTTPAAQISTGSSGCLVLVVVVPRLRGSPT